MYKLILSFFKEYFSFVTVWSNYKSGEVKLIIP